MTSFISSEAISAPPTARQTPSAQAPYNDYIKQKSGLPEVFDFVRGHATAASLERALIK